MQQQINIMVSQGAKTVEATIVTSTRQLVVYVEVYYTDDSPEGTNYLNVAVLQNDILGPQPGGGAENN